MLQKGLKGIVAAETKISHIDGEKGQLIYRGYAIKNLAKKYSFEEIAYLLWYGYLPDPDQLAALDSQLKQNRDLPEFLKKVIQLLPDHMDMMSVIRTAISAEGGYQDYSWKPSISQAIRLTALVPSIIAFRKRQLAGQEFVSPRHDLNHVANYLYMLNGTVPSSVHVEALKTYMILTQEHGMNASTFSARVTISTESDMVSAVTSAIGTMKGPLHGGAPSGVIDLLQEIAAAGDAEKVIRTKLAKGEKLMGFGHRVYKTHDPRAIALKEKLVELIGKDEWLDMAMAVEKTAVRVLEELKPGRSLYTNVEFYAAAIMKAINMDTELFTPTFTASRMAGWTAHILEQAENNTIFRPQSSYIGTLNQVVK